MIKKRVCKLKGGWAGPSWGPMQPWPWIQFLHLSPEEYRQNGSFERLLHLTTLYQVGCRTKWSYWSDKGTPFCSDGQQYRWNFWNIYVSRGTWLVDRLLFPQLLLSEWWKTCTRKQRSVSSQDDIHYHPENRPISVSGFGFSLAFSSSPLGPVSLAFWWWGRQ